MFLCESIWRIIRGISKPQGMSGLLGREKITEIGFFWILFLFVFVFILLFLFFLFFFVKGLAYVAGGSKVSARGAAMI